MTLLSCVRSGEPLPSTDYAACRKRVTIPGSIDNACPRKNLQKTDASLALSLRRLFFCILHIPHEIGNVAMQNAAEIVELLSRDALALAHAVDGRAADAVFVDQRISAFAPLFQRLPKGIVYNHIYHRSHDKIESHT